MLEAAKKGRIDEVKDLLDFGAHIEGKDEEGGYKLENLRNWLTVYFQTFYEVNSNFYHFVSKL